MVETFKPSASSCLLYKFTVTIPKLHYSVLQHFYEGDLFFSLSLILCYRWRDLKCNYRHYSPNQHCIYQMWNRSTPDRDWTPTGSLCYQNALFQMIEWCPANLRTNVNKLIILHSLKNNNKMSLIGSITDLRMNHKAILLLWGQSPFILSAVLFL